MPRRDAGHQGPGVVRASPRCIGGRRLGRSLARQVAGCTFRTNGIVEEEVERERAGVAQHAPHDPAPGVGIDLQRDIPDAADGTRVVLAGEQEVAILDGALPPMKPARN